MAWIIANKRSPLVYRGSGRAKMVDHLHLRRTLDEYEFFLVEDGELFLEQDGVGEVCLKKGDFWISRPNLSYGGSKRSTAEFEWLHFTLEGRVAEALPDTLAPDEIAIPMQGRIENADSFLVNLAQLQHYAQSPSRGHLCEHLLAAVVYEIPVLVEAAQEDFRSANRRFQDVVEYMWSSPNLQEVSSVKAMAEFFGYNEKYFIRMFTKNMGETPLQYFLDRKITRAKRYLARSEMSVREIAYELGYDYYYFMRLFKNRTGMTPMQFRASIVPDWKEYKRNEEYSVQAMTEQPLVEKPESI